MGYFLGGRGCGPRGPGDVLLDSVIWWLGSGASWPPMTVYEWVSCGAGTWTDPVLDVLIPGGAVRGPPFSSFGFVSLRPAYDVRWGREKPGAGWPGSDDNLASSTVH